MMTRRTMLAAGAAFGAMPLAGLHKAWATGALTARDIAVSLGARHVYAVGCADDAPLVAGQPVVVEFARETHTLHVGGLVQPEQAGLLRQIEAALAAMASAARPGLTLDDLAAAGRSRLDAPWMHAAAFMAGGASDWRAPLQAGQWIALEAGVYTPEQRLGGRVRRTLRLA